MSYENHEEKYWSTTSNWVCQPSHTKSRVSYPRRRVCTNQPIQLVPSWMPKPLPPRNQCTGCFAPALWDIRGLVRKSNHLPPYLFNSPIASDGNVDKIYLLQWYKDCESNFFFFPSLCCHTTTMPLCLVLADRGTRFTAVDTIVYKRWLIGHSPDTHPSACFKNSPNLPAGRLGNSTTRVRKVIN